MNLKMEIAVVKIGSGYIAGVRLGGQTVRGKRAPDEVQAVRNLCWKLAGEDRDDEAMIALELALEGTTLNRALALAEDNDGDAEQ